MSIEVNEIGSAATVAVAAIMRSASFTTLAPMPFEFNMEAVGDRSFERQRLFLSCSAP
jgi:hypothetical protein